MSEKTRDEFESRLSDNGQLEPNGDGEYSYQRTRFAWKAWQASRAALVVEPQDATESKSRTCEHIEQ